MTTKPDPVDRAMESLRTESWNGASWNEDLEIKLMQSFPKRRTHSFVRRHAVLFVSLAVVLAGGVGLAATEGPQAVKKWFVTLQLAYSPPTRSTVVTLTSPDGSTTATTSLQTVPQTAPLNVQLELEAEGGGPPLASTLQFANGRWTAHTEEFVSIPEADVIVDWQDAEGEWQELHLVGRNDDRAQGFDAYVTFYDEARQTRYRRVGAIRGLDPEALFIGDIDISQEFLATVPFLRDGETTATLQLDLTGKGSQNPSMPNQKRAPTRTTLDQESRR